MPVHDWTRVDAGIFHAFHHDWITEQNGLNAFVRKAHEALAARIHLLLVDLFPPGPRDPRGIHGAVWGDDCGPDYALPADKPLTCVAYVGGAGAEAFIEPFAVGDPLPEMPLFLTADTYVPVPLEATYQAAWDGLPARGRVTVAGYSVAIYSQDRR